MKAIVKGDKKMRKRFNVFWRIAVVLLVVASIASVAIPSGTTQAAESRAQSPNTYMDPIAQRINDVDILAPITGTTLEGATGAGYDVAGVDVQIKRAYDNWCWDDGAAAWVAAPDVWNFVAVGGTEPWTSDQWPWTFTGSWIAGDFHAGWSYTVKVRAVDSDGYVDPTPATDAFIYDDEVGDVSFTTSFPGRVYSLPEIKGNANDDCGATAGVVQQVRVAIYDSDNVVYVL